MRFAPTDEQQGFAAVLDDLLGSAGTPQVVRAWADGDPSPGVKLWQRLAEVGVTGLLVPEHDGGLGGDTVDLVVAFEALGRHAVPGPWVESAALLPALLRDTDAELRAGLLPGVVSGETLATVAVTAFSPYALDADVAGRCLVLEHAVLREAAPGALRRSVDPARRLFPLEPGAELLRLDPAAAGTARDTASLACAAQLLGAGEHLLGETVSYVRARRQFGRAVGEYQALKHALADVRVALDFARPLVHVAALALRDGSDDPARDVSAAKVRAADAAYLAARTALQLHGAVGYTAEHDLGLWILKVRALQSAWGTAALHRARVLASLTRAQEGA